MEKFVYATLSDGTVIDAYKLKNAVGASASIMTYGGRILELKMPDRNGKFDDVLLGYDDNVNWYGSGKAVVISEEKVQEILEKIKNY